MNDTTNYLYLHEQTQRTMNIFEQCIASDLPQIVLHHVKYPKRLQVKLN